MFGQVAGALDVDWMLPDAVHHECRCSNRGQDVPHVDLIAHSAEGLDVARTGTLPPGSGQRELRLPVHVGREGLDLLRRRLEVVPAAHEAIELFLRLLLTHAPGIVGRPGVASKRAPKDECPRPLRIGGREEQGQRTALGRPQERSPGGADCVHHRTDVVHAGFERGDADPVRHAGAAFVESDQAAEGGELAIESFQRAMQPGELDIRDEALNPHQVERPRPHHLIGDRDVATLRVVRFWQHRHSLARLVVQWE